MACPDGELYRNPPFFEFPFDQVLTVRFIEPRSITLLEENGQMWQLPHVESIIRITSIWEGKIAHHVGLAVRYQVNSIPV